MMATFVFALTIVLQVAVRIPQMLLPAGNGTWVVQVASSGGLTGTGDGTDFALSSEGKIVCGPALSCPDQFAASEFQSLLDAIRPDMPVPLVPQVVSLCRDCITNTITIRRRDPMGVEYLFTASWDVTTKSRLPEEVLRIYDAAVALRK
jgi:hypothetical protein